MGEQFAPRFAVYWAPPPDSLLGQLGASWLGRDAWTGRAVPRPAGLPPWAADPAMIAGPARYGFHATLKAPIRLCPGRTAAEFDAAVARLAQQLQPCALRLEVGELRGFLALRLQAEGPQLQALATAVVTALDPWRRAPGAAERARRAQGLDGRQMALLDAYGYPWVLDQFRFHVTLTEPGTHHARPGLAPWLADYFAPALALPQRLGALVVFEQLTPDLAFRVRTQHALGECRTGIESMPS